MRADLGTARLEIVRGDITLEATDAIVNAANSSLLGGGGVDGAIHRAAGPELLEACRELKHELPEGRLFPGHAVITPGFRLTARFIVHTVGPIYAQAKSDAPELLGGCYRECLRLADERGLSSIAFPSISTGAYGYPVRDAARVAMRAIARTISGTSLTLVRFVLFDETTEAAYRDASSEIVGS